MLQIDMQALLGALSSLAQMSAIATQDPGWVYGDQSRRDAMIGHLDALLKQIKILDLRLAIKKAEFLKVAIVTPNPDPAVIARVCSRHLEELQERIEQSLEDRLVYSVPAEKVDFIKRSLTIYGKEVAETFIDAAYDLDEASTSLGMSRNTACVFHLMRALEFAVQRLGEEMGVTVIDKHDRDLEWGKIISNINDHVKTMPPGDRKDEISAICSMLYHVKQAWRNSTMHPKQTYTDEEAKAVFDASRSFLRAVAGILAPKNQGA
ncbi:MAG: hypothetical protein JNL04_02345 [Rhodospirillaceae bacterium]|nr:hypothetical protein [Rhodospirillaceae bacterium]